MRGFLKGEFDPNSALHIAQLFYRFAERKEMVYDKLEVLKSYSLRDALGKTSSENLEAAQTISYKCERLDAEIGHHLYSNFDINTTPAKIEEIILEYDGLLERAFKLLRKRS